MLLREHDQLALEGAAFGGARRVDVGEVVRDDVHRQALGREAGRADLDRTVHSDHRLGLLLDRFANAGVLPARAARASSASTTN